MNECEHENLLEKKLEKEFLGKTFEYTAQVCCDCDAIIWTDEVNNSFYNWVSTCDFDRNKLTVQFKLSKTASDCLDKLLEKFPGTKRTPFIRAVVMVYLDKIAQDSEKSAILEKVTMGSIFTSFTPSERLPLKAEFNPRAMLDIMDWCEALEVTGSQLVEDILCRVVALFYETDPQLKDFWEKNILPHIQFALKVA